jgi:hypothetical protein
VIFKRITPEDMRDLVAMQRGGYLYWQDTAPAENAVFGLTSPRHIHLSKHRRDFSEAQLRQWARAGELFEGREHEQ